MAVKAAAIDLDCAGAAAGTGALDGFAGRFVHGKEFIARDLDGRQAEACGAAGDVMAADRVTDAGALAILVVLEHKDRRKLQHDGHVHRLEGGALVGCAIAREAHRDRAGVQRLGGQCGADHQGRAAADNAVGAEHPLIEIGDVHRAALAAAEPVLARKELAHHPDNVAALGD